VPVLDLTASTKPSAEHIGRARAFRDRRRLARGLPGTRGQPGRCGGGVGRAVAKVTFHTRAIIRLRALAERIQWGWQNDDAALIRDIVVLGETDIATMPESGHVTIPPGWRARGVEAETNGKRIERMIALRSWWP
jgi:hypothetical protein